MHFAYQEKVRMNDSILYLHQQTYSQLALVCGTVRIMENIFKSPVSTSPYIHTY